MAVYVRMAMYDRMAGIAGHFADGTAAVWRELHAVARAEPRTTAGAAPSLAALIQAH